MLCWPLLFTSQSELTEEDIIARMMIPLCVETVRCVEETLLRQQRKQDMGLIYGIGFPPYLGGALHYLDQMGLQAFCDLAENTSHLGKIVRADRKNA